jgi:protein-tyrosine phosphatase
MQLYKIDEKGPLYISPAIDDWTLLKPTMIDAIFNLDSDLDTNIPQGVNQPLYIYFPFEDRFLPDIKKLHALARLGASLIDDGHAVLSHCGMGHNRSALLAGLILTYLGFSGEEAVALIQSKREGALYNKIYADYLISVKPTSLF